MDQVHVQIARQAFSLTRAEIERRLGEISPDPLEEHFVVIGGRRFPPKQVIEVMTGLDRADFNTHQARRILSRLGFTVGRRSARAFPSAPPRPGPHHGAEAELLRPFAGQWVAQRDLEILIAAETPQAVVEWLERHNQRADAMFRVPLDETEVTGASPA